MLVLAAAAFAEEPAVPAAEPEARGPIGVRSAGDLGVGVTLGGGSLPGANVVFHVHPNVALDAGIGPRWGLGDGIYPTIAGMVGAAGDFGTGVVHLGPVLRFGASVPFTYTEVWVAAGASLRLYTRPGKDLFTVDLGPGYFLVRDVPVSLHEQPDYLIYLRLGWNHFVR